MKLKLMKVYRLRHAVNDVCYIWRLELEYSLISFRVTYDTVHTKLLSFA